MMANRYDMADAQFIGNMTINPGETVIVTDPCYNADVWCRLNDIRVSAGEYAAVVWQHESHIGALAIFKTETRTMFNIVHFCSKDKMEEIGEAGVDAGLCGIFTKKPDYTNEQWQEFCDLIEHLDHKMLDNELGTYGVVSSSGYGDGGYPVFARKNTDGEVDALMVVFIDDEDEEDEYDDYDDEDEEE